MRWMLALVPPALAAYGGASETSEIYQRVDGWTVTVHGATVRAFEFVDGSGQPVATTSVSGM